MQYVHLEMFYTSVNFPELHLKQCHIAKNYIKHKYPQIGNQVFSENNEYRNDIEYAIRVPIDNTHTFTKENTLRNLTPKAKLAVQEAYKRINPGERVPFGYTTSNSKLQEKLLGLTKIKINKKQKG